MAAGGRGARKHLDTDEQTVESQIGRADCHVPADRGDRRSGENHFGGGGRAVEAQARAQDANAAAKTGSGRKQAYEEALRAFNLGQWDEAVAGFQKSYKLSGDAALLFNVAQAQRQAGHVKEAIIACHATTPSSLVTASINLTESSMVMLASFWGLTKL